MYQTDYACLHVHVCMRSSTHKHTRFAIGTARVYGENYYVLVLCCAAGSTKTIHVTKTAGNSYLLVLDICSGIKSAQTKTIHVTKTAGNPYLLVLDICGGIKSAQTKTIHVTKTAGNSYLLVLDICGGIKSLEWTCGLRRRSPSLC
jgi:hypothetical protein